MKFVIGFMILVSPVANADSVTVLTLQRLNYKPEKQLVYDINYDATTCAIALDNPFDVYYRDNTTGERITEFSNESAKYFGPKLQSSVWTEQSVALEFTAFDEIKTTMNKQASIMISLKKENDVCTPMAEYIDDTKTYVLKNIDIEVRKAFGFPVGVSWVLMTGETAEGPVSDCVVGTCAQGPTQL